MLTRLKTAMFVHTLALGLMACGGGGSDPAPSPSGDDDFTDGSSSPETGSITLLVTDAETDRFNEILVTINGVVLIPVDDESERQTVLDETITVDLRALTDFSEFLAEAEVTAGEYAKLRLLVEDIELNEVDDNGSLVDTRTARVPSGRIDLNPRGSFTIDAGEAEVVLIDFDADNSFKLTETGAGNVIFRPVVFIDILGEDEDGDADEDEEPGRLARLFGQITTPDPEGSTFELCSLDMMSAGNSDVVRPDECASVAYSEETSVFLDDLSPGTTADLVENANVTVFGRVRRGPDGVVVNALLLALGESELLETVKGEVASDVVDGSFELMPLPPEEIDALQTVIITEAALVFDRDSGELIAREELVTGVNVGVVGAPVVDADNEFNAIVVAVAANDSTEEIEGVIAAIEGMIVTVSIEDDGMASDACVELNDDTEVQISGGGSDGSEVASGSPADLEVDMDIEARGRLDEGGCLVAGLVIVDAVEDES